MKSRFSRADENRPSRRLTVAQLLPSLEGGGVESCTVEINAALVARGHRSLIVSAGGRLVGEIQRDGGEHFELDIGKKSLTAFLQALKLRRLLQHEGVDIMHARSRMPAWIGLMALKLLPARRRPRFLTTVHGLNSVNPYSKVMTYGQRVIVVSESCRDYVLRNYPNTDAEKIELIPHGIDPRKYAFGLRPNDVWCEAWTKQFPFLPGRFVVLLPGRLTQLKGHLDFLAAINLLKRKGIPVAGLVVGGEDPRRRHYAESVREEVERLGLASDIYLAGHRSDLREIMCVSSAVVSTSKKPESFGRTVLESLSLGKPTVGYDHGGVGEILGKMYPEGSVPVGDVEALADKLASIFFRRLDPPRPLKLYDLETALEREVRVYEELAR